MLCGERNREGAGVDTGEAPLPLSSPKDFTVSLFPARVDFLEESLVFSWQAHCGHATLISSLMAKWSENTPLGRWTAVAKLESGQMAFLHPLGHRWPLCAGKTFNTASISV